MLLFVHFQKPTPITVGKSNFLNRLEWLRRCRRALTGTAEAQEVLNLIQEINTAADFDHAAKLDLLTTERDTNQEARKEEYLPVTGQHHLQSCPRGLVRLTRDTTQSWQGALLALR